MARSGVITPVMADPVSRDSAIDADMRGIFGAMERRRAPPIAAGAAPFARGDARRASAHGRVIGIAALAVVLLAVVATGMALFMTRREDGFSAPPPPRSAAPVVATAPPLVVAPLPEPTPPGSAQRAAQPQEDRATRTAPPAPAARPAPAAVAPASPRAPAPREARRAAPAAARAATRRRDGDEPSIDIAAAPGARRNALDCWRDPSACLDRDVLTADQRLVRAYQRAREAGVPVDRMRAVRRRWDRALARSEEDPGAMIATYNQLVDELDDARETVARER